MKLTDISPRRAVLALGVLAVAGSVAACGSSSSSSTTGASASAHPTASTTPAGTSGFNRATFTACLKQHGVTLPARPAGAGTGTTPGAGGGAPPGAGGGFFGGGGGAGGFRSNPKFAAAFKACGGGNFRFRGGAHRFRLSHTAITKYVTCVRQHGYNLPNPNFSGHGSVFPSNIRTNPKFVAASRACQSILVPARPTSTTSTTASS